MGADKFCLRWNDFDTNISSSLRELREDKVLFDVMLVSGRDQVPAHKVILSASSPLFRDILTRNPHHHPLLYLGGVSAANLKYVIDFIYNGEVNVAQDDLNSFLLAAEELQVKGLTQKDSSNTSNDKQSRNKVSHSTTTPQQQQQKNITKYSSPQQHYNRNNIVEVEATTQSVKREISEVHEVAATYDNRADASDSVEVYDEAGDFTEQYHDDQQLEYQQEDYYGSSNASQSGENVYLDMIISTKMVKVASEGGIAMWKCLECGKIYPRKGDMRRHVEANHIEHPGAECNICGKLYKNRESLRAHKSQVHKS